MGAVPTAAAGRSRFRADIEGLRAIAVLLVLLHHAGLSQPAGGYIGVDVFFVVSGFVITTQLLREVETTGSLNLLTFYGRRAKRLLPAAALVLLVTTVTAWLLVSRVQWQQIAGDVVGASVYVVNWVFAARSVDYLAEDVDPSPVLHFWSLAVEEQFYILWPLVITALIVTLRQRARRRASSGGRRGGKGGLPDRTMFVPGRRQLAIGLTILIVAPSLAFSVYYTAVSPAQAFFITPTRLWELGIGALVALGASAFAGWRPVSGAMLAWAGLVAVLVSAVVFDKDTPWPGVAALVPVLGTAAVIAGGFSATGGGPIRLLGTRPMVWIGALSYSLYLWHWPLLRFYEWQYGPPSALQGLVVVAASFVPAWLSYKLVEAPVRHARPLNLQPGLALSIGVNCSLIALVGGLLLGHQSGSSSQPAGQATGATWNTGAGEDVAEPAPPDELPLPQRERPSDEPFFDVVTPDPSVARSDVPRLYDDGCHVEVEEDVVRDCQIGDPQAEIVLAVVGDSKVAQWVPALELIAAEHGWQIRIYTKGGCSFTAAMTAYDDEPFVSCRDWSAQVLSRLLADPPTVMITSGLRREAYDEAGELTEDAMLAGYVEYWTELTDHGTAVIAISDTPQPSGRGYECAAENPDDIAGACTWTSTDGIGSATLQAATERVPGAAYIDMNPWVCPEGICTAVYRNVLTYRQGSHITATFVEVLADPLAHYLVPLVEDAAR